MAICVERCVMQSKCQELIWAIGCQAPAGAKPLEEPCVKFDEGFLYVKGFVKGKPRAANERRRFVGETC